MKANKALQRSPADPPLGPLFFEYHPLKKKKANKALQCSPADPPLKLLFFECRPLEKITPEEN